MIAPTVRGSTETALYLYDGVLHVLGVCCKGGRVVTVIIVAELSAFVTKLS